jgi:hypothetical protein
MSYQSRTSLRIIAPAFVLGTLLAGCSDIYFDRREGIVPAAVAGERQQKHRVQRAENAIGG